jgi:DNA gyrase subunit A
VETTESNSRVVKVDIDKEMRDAYLQYSMSVIVGRALPDVRDGLKPVHRRILYSMYEMGNYHNKPYKKSARVVGDVIGKYHPHGDTAVYDTIVRMAQDFSLRVPLADGQGNFGSIDGDSPAAMRYTEVRMTKPAEELLEDLDKETVSFSPNYDDSLMIPDVLPAKWPNLLVNGSAGIAVGMATNIPPHNLSEVVDGCIHLIDEPDATVDDLIKIVKGPDFPTAGVIAGRKGIVQAYKTGRGIISMRAVSEIEPIKGDKERIIVTEIPYQVNKARLIESIADLVRDKRVEGISDIRDESSREGMRIVIDVKKGENSNVILNRLYKFTQLQTNFGIIMLALHKGKPRILDLRSIIKAFIEHRRDVVTKRSIYELKKAEARVHILEGLRAALDQIDAVIAIIRGSHQQDEAKSRLKESFKFTDKQAQAILEMRLQRLTGLEREKLDADIKTLEEKIAWLKSVLSDVKEIYKIIREELVNIKELYGQPRKTEITGAVEELEDTDLIAKEDVVVTITHTGYVKRIPLDAYRTQRRGGKGLKGIETREEDFVTNIFVTDTLSSLLVFTDKGKVYWQKVFRLPVGKRESKGKAIANVVNISGNEKVQAILPVANFEDESYVVLVTKKGIIKKTPLTAFKNQRESGIIAIKVDLNDELTGAKLSNGKNDIFISTNEGMSIRFSEEDVRSMGRVARGVKAISVGKEDFVVGMELFEKESEDCVLVVSEKGYGKKTSISEYRRQSRGGVGIITLKVTDKVGKVVNVKSVDDEDVIIITDKGKTIRLESDGISRYSRNTQGVRLINVSTDEKVSSVALAPIEKDAES